MSNSSDPIDTSSQKPPRHRADKPFSNVVRAVVISWVLLGTLLVGAVALLGPEHFAEVVVITVASGLIAIGSLLPGLLTQRWRENTAKLRSNRRPNPNYASALMLGVLLRLIATVALFVMCRYQMAAPVAWIAALTIFWYVVLTSVEVACLARNLPLADHLGILAATSLSLESLNRWNP
ncbi:MAG: hypothetical protein HKN47_17100 [Pirellulaceae bacterium]|nr:hypothetical protein [Pirellulaceae bacterium]